LGIALRCAGERSIGERCPLNADGPFEGRPQGLVQMTLEIVERILSRLADLIAHDRFEELETDTLEFKSVPADGTEWHKVCQSACAFLNTRGGIILLGIREEGQGPNRRYRCTGWRPDAETKVQQLSKKFTDEFGTALHLDEAFPAPQFSEFMGKYIVAVLIDELPADVKYAFYQGDAYKRQMTGDMRITSAEIARQREFKEAALQARELELVPGVGIEDFDLDKLNDYISALNKPVKIETVKADLASAVPFLERKSFIKSGAATTLGVLVCGKHAADRLGFRCHVHGYVDVPQEIAKDKQDFVDNVLPLMERSLAYLLRNIQVGVSVERGGTSHPQYPEEVLRETVNNALAHRDYSINRQVILSVKPGRHIAIQNPGKFRTQLVIEDANASIPLRRILPEAKPRNPKLADVLRVFRKWEGRGIGMATLVNLCLQNKIDLPYYLFGTEEVTLHLRAGCVVDDRMERLFESFDRYIADKLNGGDLSEPQRAVLAYLIKSEWANELIRYTVLLTPDNNHFNELTALERSGLITKHEKSADSHPIYVADRELVRKDYFSELRGTFGILFDALDQRSKNVLSVVYRFEHFSRSEAVSAKQAGFDLWWQAGESDDIKAFDAFYRQVRSTFNRLERDGFVKRKTASRKRRVYVLSTRAGEGVLGADGGHASPPSTSAGR